MAISQPHNWRRTCDHIFKIWLITEFGDTNLGRTTFKLCWLQRSFELPSWNVCEEFVASLQKHPYFRDCILPWLWICILSDFIIYLESLYWFNMWTHFCKNRIQIKFTKAGRLKTKSELWWKLTGQSTIIQNTSIKGLRTKQEYSKNTKTKLKKVQVSITQGPRLRAQVEHDRKIGTGNSEKHWRHRNKTDKPNKSERKTRA